MDSGESRSLRERRPSFDEATVRPVSAGAWKIQAPSWLREASANQEELVTPEVVECHRLCPGLAEYPTLGKVKDFQCPGECVLSLSINIFLFIVVNIPL